MFAKQNWDVKILICDAAFHSTARFEYKDLLIFSEQSNIAETTKNTKIVKCLGEKNVKKMTRNYINWILNIF